MTLLHKIRKRIFGRWIKAREMRAMQKERDYQWQGIKIKVMPGVFHPGLFHSTLAMLDVLKKQNLSGIRFLELGCGTGLISIFAAQQGAEVTSSDISQAAIANTLLNAEQNLVQIKAVQSDLFLHFPAGETYDLIVINPPYYKANPTQEWEQAWYAGENLEYFENLFSSLAARIAPNGLILMVLSQDCDLTTIQSRAKNNNFSLLRVQGVKIKGEETAIWRILSAGL